jgi:hypothetical protein
MLLSALDRIERKLEKLDGDIDMVRTEVRELEMKMLRKEAVANKAKVKILTGVALAGGVGGTGLAKLLAMFGM